MKTSWARLIEALRAGQVYLQQHPEKTQLEYAIQRSIPRIARMNDGLQEQLEAIDIALASTDADGNLILQGRSYAFKPEKKLACNKERMTLLKAENVEYDPYLAAEIPDKVAENITELELEAFDGIVIKAEDVARIRASREDEPEKSRTATEGN